MNKPIIIFALTGIVLGLPASASAYVRTRTEAGLPAAWKSPCVIMEFALGGFPAELDAASYLDAAQQAGAAWTQATLDGSNRCSNVQLGAVFTADVEGPVGRDGHNRIIFRQKEWCRDPPPTNPKEPRCYDPSALAITTVVQLVDSGEIVDADIEVNAATKVNGIPNTWGDLVDHPEAIPSTLHDFQGTITHEFGHVLGLEHTCYIPAYLFDGTPAPRPVDNTGNPIPDCSANNPPLITDATMYPSVSSPAEEVLLRDLSPDDVQAVCDIYPHSSSFVCGAPTTDAGSSSGKGGGCSLGRQHRSVSVAGLLVLAALALRLGQRRQR